MYHQVYGAPANHNLIPLPNATDEADQYNYLIGNLTMGQPVVLILGTATGWPHAVVAWGAGTIGNGNLAGDVVIYLYDSNFPQTTTEAIYNPVTESFSYDYNNVYSQMGLTFSRFYVMNAAAINEFWAEEWQAKTFVQSAGGLWWGDWVTFSPPGYNIVLADKMVTIDSNGLEDYFTTPGDSQTFVKGIPGSSGIEEGNMQVYALTQGWFSVVDPASNQSTILITRVDNESGQLVGYGYLLNETTTYGLLNYTVTPSNSGLLISSGANPLNVSITIFYATSQNHCIFQASNIQLGSMQTANFTVNNWQALNNTSSAPVAWTISSTVPTIPEFQPSMLTPLFMIITLVAAMVIKRKRNVKK
jgi:hypothetical protein